MNIKYIDKKGIEIKLGDILKYDEGVGYARQIHEVISINNELMGKIIIGCPLWTKLKFENPVGLIFYQLMGHKDESGICYNAEIIGNINDNTEMLSIETAIEIFGADGEKQ